MRQLTATGSALLGIFLFLSSWSLPAQGPADLGRAGSLDLGSGAAMWFDADPGLGIGELSSPAFSGRFSPLEGSMIWVGRKAPVAWLRFAIPDPAGTDELLLEFRPSFTIILDRAELWLPDGRSGWTEAAGGALVDRGPLDLPSTSILFRLPASARGRTGWLRLESRRDVMGTLHVWKATALLRHQAIEIGAYGLIYGILIATLLHNLFLFISLRDRNYLWFVLCMASGGLWTFWVQGHARLAIGGHPGLDQALLWFFVGALLTCASVFADSFLELRSAPRRQRRILRTLLLAMAALGGATSVAGLAGLDDLAFDLSHAGGFVLPIILIAVAAWRLARGYRPALYFILAWSCYAAGGFLFTLMGLQLVPVSFLSVNGVSLGLSLAAVLLAMALADRIRRLEGEKCRLEKTEARYRALSLTDELTGLWNKRFLIEELAGLRARARSEGQGFSLLLLDLDDFKVVNDNWGHPTGDLVLKRLAEIIRSCIREGDRACRFGGEEFVIILPGIGLEDALRAAERIRERFASPGTEAPGGVLVTTTLSLGVAELGPQESGEELLNRADKAMYEAKRLGKNRAVAG